MRKGCPLLGLARHTNRDAYAPINRKTTELSGKFEHTQLELHPFPENLGVRTTTLAAKQTAN